MPITPFRHTPTKSNIPIPTSSMANKTMDVVSDKSPKESSWMVFLAKPSAGLNCGKNFRLPNHKYTTPILMANRFDPIFFCIPKSLVPTNFLVFIRAQASPKGIGHQSGEQYNAHRTQRHQNRSNHRL